MNTATGRITSPTNSRPRNNAVSFAAVFLKESRLTGNSVGVEDWERNP